MANVVWISTIVWLGLVCGARRPSRYYSTSTSTWTASKLGYLGALSSKELCLLVLKGIRNRTRAVTRIIRAVMGHWFRGYCTVIWNRWSRGIERGRWRLYGPYKMGRTGVVSWIWVLLWAGSRVDWGWARSVVILFGVEVRWWVPVEVFFGRPSSTSAHSAGVGREGGRCSWLSGFCMSLRPLAHIADTLTGKSSQAKCTLRAPEIQTKDNVRGILINRNK